jgi:hypothetical protein
MKSTVEIEPKPILNEGIDHYKNLFSFSKQSSASNIQAQRKVEYENYRFKYPSLLAVVIEGINVKVTENQRMLGKVFYRFHISEDMLVSEMAEILKFRLNSKIREEEDKLGPKDRILVFNNR